MEYWNIDFHRSFNPLWFMKYMGLVLIWLSENQRKPILSSLNPDLPTRQLVGLVARTGCAESTKSSFLKKDLFLKLRIPLGAVRKMASRT
ncbi:MAG: hypothetical protein ACE5KZ_13270 [Candidatus Scalinduaceae bacterium]